MNIIIDLYAYTKQVLVNKYLVWTTRFAYYCWTVERQSSTIRAVFPDNK